MAFSATGNLQKLRTVLADPVQYYLPIGKEECSLNPYLGQIIHLKALGINCIYCGRAIKKSYQQGYCFPCVQKLARCDLCIVMPSKCHYHLGTCREPSWGLSHCFMEHVVYLANTSGFKVGITRAIQMQTRWIDQGAIQALPIIRVQNRYQSGLIEAFLKTLVADRTNWKKMLSAQPESVDLFNKRDELWTALKELKDASFNIQALEFLKNEKLLNIRYPVLKYPTSLKAINLEKTPQIHEILWGIKGQYLILESGVLNIRNVSGYQVEFSA